MKEEGTRNEIVYIIITPKIPNSGHDILILKQNNSNNVNEKLLTLKSTP